MHQAGDFIITSSPLEVEYLKSTDVRRVTDIPPDREKVGARSTSPRLGVRECAH